MKQNISVILGVIGIIGSLLGFFDLFSSANQIQYRQKPGSLITSDERNVVIRNNRNNKDIPFDQVLHPDPADTSLYARLWRADIYHSKRNEANAILELTFLVQSYPEFTKGYYFRGLLNLSTGNTQQGIADLRYVSKYNDDMELRLQAEREITRAQVAAVAKIIVYLGIIALVAFFIAFTFEVEFSKWGRATKAAIYTVFIIWVASFFFLLSH